MIKQVLLFSIGVFCTLNISAQKADYAITSKQDTVFGKFNIVEIPYSGQKLKVKNGKNKQDFWPHEITLLKKGKSVYHVKKIGVRYQFVELQKDGYLSLYGYTSEDNKTGQLFQQAILITKDGRQLSVPNISFRKFTSTFLDDCPQVSQRIRDGELVKKNLNAIIDQYNSCDFGAAKTTAQKKTTPKKVLSFNEWIAVVRSDKKLSENQQLIEMLDDVSARLSKNEKVPGYLHDLIKKELSSNKELLQGYIRLAE